MSETKVHDFTDLIAWQKSHALVLKTYQVAKNFPEYERFVLTSQITRAAISITSNIAEGFGRNTAKDKRHFYSIAKGSALELRSQSRIAKDFGYMDEDIFIQFEHDAIEVLRLISGIILSAQDFN